MKILYGIVGEGMGHATRSKVILDELCAQGHEIAIVVSGRAHAFIARHFGGKPNITIEEIHGFTLDYDNNELDLSDSVLKNLKSALPGLAHNIEVYREVAERRFRPNVVISDFESWAYVYGLLHHLPVISIDNMQVLNRCAHAADVTEDHTFAFKLAKLAVKVKLPHAYHYLVSTFFFPRVRKHRTTLVPPILRREIFRAVREPGAHVLVYQTAEADRDLVGALKALPYEFRFYGRGGTAGREGNVTFRPFSEDGFIEDLRTARAVIATGGYSLMGEAVHLGVPLLAHPIQGQFEQELNGLYLRKLGYGDTTHVLSRDVVEGFLTRTAAYERALQHYPRQPDNGMLFGCLDELLANIRARRKPADRLRAPAMGAYEEGEDER
jgi:uncharacterized protein (TIGR00661 family)